LNAHVLTSQSLAQSAVGAVTSAVVELGQVQGAVGSIQNRLNFAINLARNQVVNNRAAESRIRDANIATESAQLTRFSILNQSGLAALAQANASSGAVLSLLQ
jgi:flagellin